MAGEKVNRRIGVEDSLRAVAVMHVPIDDRYTFNLAVLILSVSRRDGDVVKKAKAHCPFMRCVMSWRTDRNKCVADLAGHYQINCLTRSSCGVSSRVKRIHRNGRISIEVTNSLGDCSFYKLV